ncbi:Diacylglycerol kinase catalytic domain containing protein, putative [Trypanosoma equiperdum]|uniref:DAGKc domain-containing protein n=2 Tax=Trypanozoon TaxID=39700 RepID=Q585M7_TRYB2|nr:hypothetical protein, conserved [Trypanosoma brucei brucei TREU927]AAX79707.1 hypothetical protein, conserved [Trypanosoma brucei]AAZ11746.1 hypothetical protein, conserved [Trypanosoma brucei brucei TREU927]SCU71755.1 Diacylglycerol kinase catalytic domain containing protein, putative [Trypanosoma equiperdum]
MSRFKRCLAIVNTRSGAREGLSVFASALRQYLDNAGIVHHDVCVPEKDIICAMERHAGGTDAIIVCGGDGTLSSVVNVLAATPNHPLAAAPIVLVPCGLQNSVAASLGIFSAERSVSAFVLGRVEQVPLWEVRINGALTRYVASYLAVGTYAMCVKRLHELDAVGDNYISLPMVRGKYRLGAFYTAMRNETISCSATLTCCTRGGKGKKDAPGALGRSHVLIQSPMKMLLASQMPFQHRHYTLTPNATFKRGSMCVTHATHEATRMRLWHLLSREAIEGVVLNEDGVGESVDVTGLEFTLHAAREGAGGRSGAVMMLDGEAVQVFPGSTVSVQRSTCHALLASC